MTPRKSFTLIELLIVITIIGILAVALIPRIAGAPARARDVQRKADIGNLAAASEQYYADNGNYFLMSSCISESAGVGAALAPYISDGIPLDPSNQVLCISLDGLYRYSSMGGTDHYAIIADLEVDSSIGDNIYCDLTSFSWSSFDDFMNKIDAATCDGTGDAYYIYYH